MLVENRHSLIVDVTATTADGTAEVDTALLVAYGLGQRRPHPVPPAAEAYDGLDLVKRRCVIWE